MDSKSIGPFTVQEGDPINAATGNKYQQDTDFRGSSWLTFRRFYNSIGYVSQAELGPQWRHSFDRSLEFIQLYGQTHASTIYLYRPDASREAFTYTNGVWVAGADSADALIEHLDGNGNIAGYTVTIAALRHTENYNAAGLLQSVTDPTGQGIVLTYSTMSTPSTVAPKSNLLLTVTDTQSRQLSFTYNSQGNLSQVTLPDSGTLIYGYNATSGLLTSVQYPDGKNRQYVYNESSLTKGNSLPNALTGVIDEAGVRYESTGYNYYGAVSSSFAGGADATTIQSGQMQGSVTTPLGVSLAFDFKNALGALKPSSSSKFCALQCNQSFQSITYDANGYPSSTTDFKNVVTKTTYDANGLLDQEVDASGTANQRTIKTTWNIPLRVPLTRTVLDNNGNTVAQMGWVYNAAGQPTAQCQMDPTIAAASSYTCATTGTPPSGVRRSTATYCTAVDTTQCPLPGLLLSTTGPRTDLAQTKTYAYYLTDSATAKHGDLQSITDALGHVTTYASYDGAGRVTRIIDPNGVITDLTYTPRGWLSTRTVRALASGQASSNDAVTTINYTPYGALASIADPDGIVTTYGYDAAHRLTSITDAQGNTIQYTLDASGNRTKEQTFAAGAATATRTLSRKFNTLGQLTTVTDGLSHTVFNASGSGNYDANGNLVQSADALGYQRKQGYDALNRLVSTIDNYNGTDTATKNTTSSLTYDALDRLTSVTDPSSLKTSYIYDGLGNGASLQSPDTGTSTGTFDAAGNRLSYTDTKGVVSTSTYDALNRLTSTSYTDTTLNVAYHYDESNAVTGCAVSSPVGLLTRVVENTVTTTYCYDSHGNVIQKTQATATATDITSYSYTAANRLSGVTTPDGTAISYAFDGDGRISGVQVTSSGASAASTVVSSVTYQPFGPISSYTLGNGQTVTRAYDANYHVTDIASPAFTLHLARDLMGDVSAIGPASGANPATETYAYDPLYRLGSVTEANGSVLESYTYNPTGDRLSKTAPGLATGTYLYTSGTHQLQNIGNATQASDVNGNTTGSVMGGATYGFAYNARNRLSLAQLNGSTVGTYSYNALGQRIGKVTATAERYGYNENGQLLAEYGATNRDYLWLDEVPVAVIDNATNDSVTTSTVNYITADQLNTPRAVTNSAGAVIWSWAYQGNPFGEQQPASTTGYVLNLRYPGQYYDAETGTNYNLFRTYEPATGRYLQSDPIGLNGGISTYAYVGGNSVNRTDPQGLACNGQGCWTTPEERNFLNNGDPDGYYQAACAGGDKYACFARHVEADDNTNGHIANTWLKIRIEAYAKDNHQCVDEAGIMNQVRSDLANAYANYLPDSEANARFPTDRDVAQIHWNEFAKFGLPPSTFGGTPFGTSIAILPRMWCPNCTRP